MNRTLMHRINSIESEMEREGALDLRVIATHPLADANWADPARTSFDPLGVECALPAAFIAPPPAKPPRAIDWQLVCIYTAAGLTLGACLALSVWPIH